MTNKFKKHLGITANGKSILKSDRNPSGLPVAPAASGKTASVVLPTLTASTAESIKAATYADVSRAKDGGHNPFFRTSLRQRTPAEVLSFVEMLLGQMK